MAEFTEIMRIKNIKELRTLNQPQIDELVHGQEVEVPKLSDEEVNELLITVNPNEVTKDCEDCKTRLKAEALKDFKDLGKLYSEIRADAIEECVNVVNDYSSAMGEYYFNLIIRKMEQLKEKQ